MTGNPYVRSLKMQLAITPAGQFSLAEYCELFIRSSSGSIAPRTASETGESNTTAMSGALPLARRASSASIGSPLVPKAIGPKVTFGFSLVYSPVMSLYSWPVEPSVCEVKMLSATLAPFAGAAAWAAGLVASAGFAAAAACALVAAAAAGAVVGGGPGGRGGRGAARLGAAGGVGARGPGRVGAR